MVKFSTKLESMTAKKKIENGIADTKKSVIYIDWENGQLEHKLNCWYMYR